MATFHGDERYRDNKAIPRQSNVIVVRAGRVGLLTALRLRKNGIKTIVLAAHDELLPFHRAMVYMPVVLPVLDSLGILGKVKAEAYLIWEGVTWRDRDGKELAYLSLESETSGECEGALLIGQAKMKALILEETKYHPSVQIIFSMWAVRIDNNQNNDFIRLICHTTSQAEADVSFGQNMCLVLTEPIQRPGGWHASHSKKRRTKSL